MQEFDVLNIGIIVADIPVKMPVSVIDFQADTVRIPKIQFLSGGDAANSSVVLSQLGRRVALAGALGDDPFGHTVKNILSGLGVDTDFVRMKPEVQTSVSIVLVNEAGDRTFVCTSGNNATLCQEDIDETLLGNVRHINLSSLFAHPKLDRDCGVLPLFLAARQKGITVSADAGHDHYGTGFEGLKNVLSAIDIFMPSYVEAKYMSGENDPKRMAEFFVRQTGEKTVVIKLGEAGCYVYEKGQGHTVPAFKVPVVDTTGAGDTFVAGFIDAHLAGMPALECAKFASAAAAVAVGYLGATSPEFKKESVLKLFEQK